MATWWVRVATAWLVVDGGAAWAAPPDAVETAAAQAPAASRVEVTVTTPEAGGVVGARFKVWNADDIVFRRWIRGDVPYNKAESLVRMGEGFTLDTAAIEGLLVASLTAHYGGDGQALPELHVALRVREVVALESPVALAGRVALDWVATDAFGDELGRGGGLGTAAALPPDDTLEGVALAAVAQAVEQAADSAAMRMAVTSAREHRSAAPGAESPMAVAACANPVADLPGVVASTVVVRAGDRVGAGVVVSPDGYVVTARHVVAGASIVTIRRDRGEAVAAKVVREARSADVALLSFPADGGACVAPRATGPVLGEDLYAVGTPLGESLAFSISRGIVSGLRQVEGLSVLQTDASFNRGNSGGPLVDAAGAWLGVVSAKVIGGGAEGLGFGIPTADALAALGLTWTVAAP